MRKLMVFSNFLIPIGLLSLPAFCDTLNVSLLTPFVITSPAGDAIVVGTVTAPLTNATAIDSIGLIPTGADIGRVVSTYTFSDLIPGQVYTGPLLDIEVRPITPIGVYQLGFDLTSVETGSRVIVGSGSFQVQITDTPEPVSVVLIGSGLVALLLASLCGDTSLSKQRRRRSSTLL